MPKFAIHAIYIALIVALLGFQIQPREPRPDPATTIPLSLSLESIAAQACLSKAEAAGWVPPSSSPDDNMCFAWAEAAPKEPFA